MFSALIECMIQFGIPPKFMGATATGDFPVLIVHYVRANKCLINNNNVKLVECPHGDDPLTTSQLNEIQLLVCSASDGYFELFFNGEGTTIQADTSADMFKEKLQVSSDLF